MPELMQMGIILQKMKITALHMVLQRIGMSRATDKIVGSLECVGGGEIDIRDILQRKLDGQGGRTMCGSENLSAGDSTPSSIPVEDSTSSSILAESKKSGLSLVATIAHVRGYCEMHIASIDRKLPGVEDLTCACMDLQGLIDYLQDLHDVIEARRLVDVYRASQ